MTLWRGPKALILASQSRARKMLLADAGVTFEAMAADIDERSIQEASKLSKPAEIAGLLARRIVFSPKVGDHVARGQRVGLIKFGSRVDVILDSMAQLQVQAGSRVRGGASVLAFFGPESGEPVGAAAQQERGGRP